MRKRSLLALTRRLVLDAFRDAPMEERAGTRYGDLAERLNLPKGRVLDACRLLEREGTLYCFYQQKFLTFGLTPRGAGQTAKPARVQGEGASHAAPTWTPEQDATLVAAIRARQAETGRAIVTCDAQTAGLYASRFGRHSKAVEMHWHHLIREMRAGKIADPAAQPALPEEAVI